MGPKSTGSPAIAVLPFLIPSAGGCRPGVEGFPQPQGLRLFQISHGISGANVTQLAVRLSLALTLPPQISWPLIVAPLFTLQFYSVQPGSR